ncbi:precorrin-6Y C5,15-methyltransferase (Decarboxylating), CbiT subunit [Candidatus Moduliflexus flocculans]|uniref:Precorrin-6Y C5,15-methyltransferase (Decarboxylating), CbiT subunit n=1 Tax=Candidatus Moduliflexus flocculans TaxID=1499966 RepID=A0A0S6VVX2_9BACT|nr:precorrin-6Y C5,15-methyltransferase (Decarboxylating), CbiT subunit [Candidatus Moduliflexus flocculans]
MKWLRDDEFERGEIPMTKFEARVLSLALSGIGAGDLFVDIGAGTGSIAVQAALLGADVYAIEREAAGVALIQKNADKFGVRIQVLHGSAPEQLAEIQNIDACFIGGSGGQLPQIVREAHRRLRPGGRIVANFIRPDTMTQFTQLLKECACVNVETRLLQTAVSDSFGMLRGQNPIFLVSGIKCRGEPLCSP